jgi:hypothetical protein
VVHEEPDAFVDHQVFHECGADAHGHGADHLAARGFGIQDTAGVTHGQHAPHADFGGGRVHRHLDEVRAERRLRVFLIEIAPLDGVFPHESLAGQLRQRHTLFAERHVAVFEHGGIGIEAGFLRDGFTQLHAGRVHTGRGAHRAELAARPR